MFLNLSFHREALNLQQIATTKLSLFVHKQTLRCDAGALPVSISASRDTLIDLHNILFTLPRPLLLNCHQVSCQGHLQPGCPLRVLSLDAQVTEVGILTHAYFKQQPAVSFCQEALDWLQKCLESGGGQALAIPSQVLRQVCFPLVAGPPLLLVRRHLHDLRRGWCQQIFQGARWLGEVPHFLKGFVR